MAKRSVFISIIPDKSALAGSGWVSGFFKFITGGQGDDAHGPRNKRPSHAPPNKRTGANGKTTLSKQRVDDKETARQKEELQDKQERKDKPESCQEQPKKMLKSSLRSMMSEYQEETVNKRTPTLVVDSAKAVNDVAVVADDDSECGCKKNLTCTTIHDLDLEPSCETDKPDTTPPQAPPLPPALPSVQDLFKAKPKAASKMDSDTEKGLLNDFLSTASAAGEETNAERRRKVSENRRSKRQKQSLIEASDDLGCQLPAPEQDEVVAAEMEIEGDEGKVLCKSDSGFSEEDSEVVKKKDLNLEQASDLFNKKFGSIRALTSSEEDESDAEVDEATLGTTKE